MHLPKSPVDGPLIAAEVKTLCTPVPVYLCTLRREPQTGSTWSQYQQLPPWRPCGNACVFAAAAHEVLHVLLVL